MDMTEDKTKIELSREEIEALMDCVAVTKKGIQDENLNIPNLAMARIKNVNLLDLWTKMFEASKK